MSTAKHTGSEVDAAAKDQSSRRALLKSGALAGVAARSVAARRESPRWVVLVFMGLVSASGERSL